MDQRRHDDPVVTYDDVEYHEDMYLYYHDRRFTGWIVETDERGLVIEEISYLEGFQEGPEIEYYPDGTMKSERTYKRALPHGLARTWHENGNLKSETIYDEGRAMSEQRWSADGQPSPVKR
jgi:antitoxin component YwqK of YwqJK toxin-antitoxin module